MKNSKINQLLTWVRTTVLKIVTDIFDLVEEKGPEAVKLAQKVKQAIEDHDPKVNWLLTLTENEKDDQTYAFIKVKLPVLIHELTVLDGLVHPDTSPEVAARVYADFILNKQKEGRAKEWVNLAAKILIAILGKKIPMDIAIMATQRFYRKLFGKK